MDVAIEIAAPPEKVWDLLVDTKCWAQWGPSITEVECQERYIRLGSRGWVRIPLGVWIPFEITDFDPERRWGWRVLGMPATGHRLEPIDARRTKLIFELPPLAFPYALVCRLAGKRISTLLAPPR